MDDVLEIAMKYYRRASKLIEPDLLSEFRRVIAAEPVFDGKTKKSEFAVKLSHDVADLSMCGAPNVALAVACAAFDMVPNAVWAVNNLGNAIAMFCDNSADDFVRSKEQEIYADAETVLRHAVGLSMVGSIYTESSLPPLVSLGNLWLDMKKLEEAKGMFEAALRVRKGYPRAIAGMMAYYRAKGMPQMAMGVARSAGENKTVIGDSFDEIIKNNNDVELGNMEQRNEEEMEKYMDKLCEVNETTYADIFGKIDPETARKTRESVKRLNDKMRITVPDVSMLTAFTAVNSDNIVSIKKATEAVAEELQHIIKYTMRYSSASVYIQADTLERLGIDTKVAGLAMPDFMRDAAKNPKKYENRNLNMGGVAQDVKSKMMAFADDAMSGINSFMSMDFSSGDRTKFFQNVGKVEPLVAVQGLNPYDYANAWDVMIQQFNAKKLLEKTSAIGAYIGAVNSKTLEIYSSIVDKAQRDLMDLAKREGEEEDAAWERYTKDDSPNARKRYDIALHKIHLKYYPQYDPIYKRIFAELTQFTSMGYKKLERYVPKMYQTAMKHLVLISDLKIRARQEEILVGTIATGIQTALQLLLGAYGHAAVKDIRECGCDEELLKAYEAEIKAAEKKEGNAKIEKQRAAKNAFKNGIIDENSSFYKDYIKKYEREWNFIFFKYRTNEHFTVVDTNIWTPWGSFGRSSHTNHISGSKRVSCDLSLGLDAGAVSGGAKFGYSYVKDKNGNIHPDDLDIRAGLEASAGKGPLSSSLGMEASLQRGTKVYGKLELTGSEYIDAMKEAHFGKHGKWIRTELPAVELWSGEYNITDKN